MDDIYGVAEPMESGVHRILAPNPSPMTHRGTCSYVLGDGRRGAIVDPGPQEPGHLEALLAACGEVECILVTHAHLDHSPGAAALAAKTGAPIWGWRYDAGRSDVMARLAHLGGGEGVDPGFAPDHIPEDGTRIEGTGWTVDVLWTPGHMASHLSFVLPSGTILSGDVAMGWASTMISPPDGDVTQFLGTMERLAQREGRLLPGHGEAVEDGAARCIALRDHRLTREAAILDAVGINTTIPLIVEQVYTDTPTALHPAAARNVLAHLVRLVETGSVACDTLGPDGAFTKL